MKRTAAILGLGMALGTAWAQNPSIIDSTRAKLNAVQQQKTADSNAALAATQGKTAAPPTAASSKAATVPAKPAPGKAASASPAPVPPAAAANKSTAVTVAPATAPKAAAKAAPTKPAAKADASKTPAKADASKTAAKKDVAKAKVKSTAIAVSKPSKPKPVVAVEDKKNPVEPKKTEHKTISMEGRRDPFVSPVVNRSAIGSGCSTGKRCLAIDQIILSGIVKADTGMIAVVVNALNKAYFLRENDPVFNGYVVRITGDSIIFKETLQDKLGKPFSREVTKKISTPAV